MTTRRQFIKGTMSAAALVALPAALAACASPNDAEKSTTPTGADAHTGESPVSGNGGEVVFADYGGNVGEARRSIFFDPFEKETGIKVVQANADPARYLMMGTRKLDPQWDALDAENFLVAQYVDQGLLAKLPDWVKKSDYIESPYSDYVTGSYNQSFNMGFSKNLISSVEPDSWADFWDVNKIPGKRALPGFAAGTIEAALLADGVPRDALFPLDFNRAFAKLDALKDDLLIFQDFGEGQQMLQSESVVMGLLPNGRIQPLVDKNEPFGIVWNEALLMKWVGFPIMANSPNKENMFQLASFMADPERQVAFAKATGYGPVLSAAYDGMDDALAARLPGSPEHVKVAALLDAAGTAKQLEEYNTRLTEWLAS